MWGKGEKLGQRRTGNCPWGWDEKHRKTAEDRDGERLGIPNNKTVTGSSHSSAVDIAVSSTGSPQGHKSSSQGQEATAQVQRWLAITDAHAPGIAA